MPDTIQLDVRDDLKKGLETFSKIMGATVKLQPGQNLLLLAPFEPKPLFDVLARQGFSHSARQMEGGDWEVLFTRDGKNNSEPRKSENKRPVVENSALRAPHFAIVEVDARGLEPPQPMVKILEMIAALPDGAELRARTDRRPMHLYAQLESRGFTGQTEEQNDGSFITIIKSR
jgi:uncharacterized protein (DUF2249 family)